MARQPETLPPRPSPLSWSEHRLQALSDRTFLRLWSYPGISKDQGSGGGGRGGKEVCDLLVVFEEHVVIFSDKTCAFPNTGDLKLDWSRWYDRAIVRSVKQLRGAERWIRTFPDRLYLDRECKHPFPYALPSAEEARFHRILVAGGAGRRCREELGGSGSLMLRLDPFDPADPVPPPFSVGHVDSQSGFVHVMDDFTLDVVLGTLDTISDFVGYLSAKENLVESGTILMAAGEEELLAHYLKNTGPDGRHAFTIPPAIDGAWFDEGGWEEFARNPQRLAQVEADKVSYAWDNLVEKFTYYATTGGSSYRTYDSISDFERSVRFMAREPRTRRRMLAKALLGIMERPEQGTERATRVVFPSSHGDPYYVFLSLMRPAERSDEEYRAARRHLLEALCMTVRARWPEALDVVGVATDPMGSKEMSEDLLYLDGRHWSGELQEEAEQLSRELNLLTNLRLRQGREHEYPDATGARRPAKAPYLKPGRNDPCPCRSGKKFKKCCGSPSAR